MTQARIGRLFPGLGALLGLLAQLLLPGLAQAQTRGPDTLACRRSCNVTPGVNPISLPRQVQACLIRCQAQERYLRQDGRRGSASASGLGVAPRSGPPLATAVPSINTPNHGQQARIGALYAGLPPSAGFGLTIGLVDRITAHHGAETECMNINRGAPCMLLGETAERCAAIGQLIQRSQAAIAVTEDPRTYRITAYAYGTGPTSAAAEQAALNDCRRRDARSFCRIAASRCGNG